MTVMTGDMTQRTIAGATGGGEAIGYRPHHPIACMEGELGLHANMTLVCPHVHTKPHDRRTQAAVNHSVALLICELASFL
jgi:hypothetical protein